MAAPPGSEPAARRFYGEMLGLPEIEKPAELKARGGVWFACGDSGQQLHVGIQQDFAPATKAHPALAVTELPPELDVVRDGPRIYTQDPWGNRIELVVVTSSAPR